MKIGREYFRQWTKSVKNIVVGTCPELEAKIQNPKSVSERCFINLDIDSGYIGKIYLVVQILYFRNTEQSYLCMAVTGIDIKAVNTLTRQKHGDYFGAINSVKI